MTLHELAQVEHRRQRRRGVMLTVLGTMFSAIGVLAIVLAQPWMGALLVTFGTTFLVSGILMAARNNSTAARRWMIVACTLFALTSALMIIVRVIEPGSFRHRPALGGVIVGALGIMFFGTGSIVLLVRERRHRLRGR